MDFPKKQAQRLMPLYLLEYSEKLFTNHPDPSAPWGGGGGSDYTAGQGITITNNEISVDTNVIATKSDLPTKTSELTNDSNFISSSLGNTKTYSKYESSPHSGYWKRVTYDTSGILIETNDNTRMLGFPINKEGEIAVTSDIPSLDGYATETWVQNQGYATSSEIPTNYVTTDTEQTITGLKTIGQTSGTISEVDFNGFTFKLSNKAINHPEADIKVRNSSYDGYQYPTIYSSKGLYVNLAKIKLGDDGNNTYGITMPDSSTWESDRVLATTNDIPDTSKFVTTDTAQTITGLKTFKDYLCTEDTADGFRSYIFPNRVQYMDTNQDIIKATIFALPTSKPSGSEYTLATTDDIPSLDGYATQTWVENKGYATSSSLATVATTGSYNDLTNTPTIPDAVSGTNDGTNWTTLTIGNSTYDIPQGGSASDLDYHNGDTYVNSGYFTSSGYITNSQKEITFSIILPKLLTNITSVTVNKLQGLLRGVGGYVNGSSDIDYARASGYTIKTYIGAPNAVTIMIVKSSAHSGSTNNTPINFAFAVNGLQLTFNE